ncbi:MAG TPA: BrnT family toxin [Terriglobia bacterium]|nr:BrnT family toxin [Terriglobia bacterium]
MRIDDVEWTFDRVDHIADHGILPEEVEEILGSAPFFKRGRGGVYEAWGQTDAGRYLLVIFRYLGHNRAWPITAREMDENEKRFCRKR